MKNSGYDNELFDCMNESFYFNSLLLKLFLMVYNLCNFFKYLYTHNG